MARIFGSDCTPNGLRFQFADRIKPLGKQQLAILDAGKDPKDLDLGIAKGARGNGQNSWFSFNSFPLQQFFFTHEPRFEHYIDTLLLDMAKLIGSDCTKGALEWQFRRYKAGGKLQTAALRAGQDPKDINVDVNPQGKPDAGKSSCNFFQLFRFHSTTHHIVDDLLIAFPRYQQVLRYRQHWRRHWISIPPD
jgi:hypothetical protein